MYKQIILNKWKCVTNDSKWKCVQTNDLNESVYKQMILNESVY